MVFRRLVLLACLAALGGCTGGGGNVPVPNASVATSADAFQLGPEPLALTDADTFQAVTAQNDVPGATYTPVADASCLSTSGGVYVSGNGIAQTDVSGVPLLFLVYAVGTPPASCFITVTGSNGQSATVDITYAVVQLQTSSARKAMAAPITMIPGTVAATVSMTKANQLTQLAVSGFTGTTTATASCTSAPAGVQVSPSQYSTGSGTFVVVPVGQGAINKSCTVSIADTAGHSASVPINVATTAMVKFTGSPHKVQFGCAASATPIHCQTVQSVAFTAAASAVIAVRTSPGIKDSCANAFNGPLRLVSNGTASVSVNGPTASVAFDGLLPATTLSCTKIAMTDGGDPAQNVTLTIDSKLAAAPPPAISSATAPNCTGTDPNVAMPSAVHGMFVWLNGSVGQDTIARMSSDVINKDKALCGASIVINWSDVQPDANNPNFFTWDKVTMLAQPYVTAGLTVNLLFADSTEATSGNSVTAPYVIKPVSQGGLPTITCPGGATIPVYFNAQYEADWEALIQKAIQQFSGTGTALNSHIGYMRFGIGGGAEDIDPSGAQDGGVCQQMWAASPFNFSYTTWLGHVQRIINYIASQSPDKQINVSLAGTSPVGDPNFPNPTPLQIAYAAANQTASIAVPFRFGLSFENLGKAGVPPTGTTPTACNVNVANPNLHWCQPYTKYAGTVPLAAQPITGSLTTPDFANMMRYGLDNNIQIYELYPDHFFGADSPSWSGYIPSLAPTIRAALDATSLVVGANPKITTSSASGTR
jgi:hypothetical protein